MLDYSTLIASIGDYDIFEGMTSISAVIKSVSQSSNSRNIIAVMYDESRAVKIHRELSFLKRMSSQMGFELLPVDSDKISKITSGDTHGGVVAITTKRILSNDFLFFVGRIISVFEIIKSFSTISLNSLIINANNTSPRT